MKKAIFALLHATRVIKLVSWLNRKQVPIVCYHSVTEARIDSDPHKQHIPRQLFLEHLDYLQQQYNVVSLSDYLAARREKRRLPDKSVVLTFDDGFEDFFAVVAPQLRERKLPATVFVITERAEGKFIPNGESFLNWSEIQALAAQGVDIGSHTCSHSNLTEMSPSEATKELRESYERLESRVGRSQLALSYPFGQMSESIAGLAESVGYSCAIANDYGLNSDTTNLFKLSRTVIASDDDVATFSARVAGLTWWISKCRQLLRSDNNVSGLSSFAPNYGPPAPETYPAKSCIEQASS